LQAVNGNVSTPDLAGGFDMSIYTSATATATFSSSIALGLFQTNDVPAPNRQSNAIAFLGSGSHPLLAYVTPTGPVSNVPPLNALNWTMSFWVKADPTNTLQTSGGPRVMAIADDGPADASVNLIWDVSIALTSVNTGVYGQIDHFVRQSPAAVYGGLQYGNFSGGDHDITTNAPAFTTPGNPPVWHNITITQTTITNVDKPVLAPAAYTPGPNGTVTLTWNTEALDNLTNNAPYQIDTNQNYLVYASSSNILGPWTLIATVPTGGGGLFGTPGVNLTYTDNNATNKYEFYKVTKPPVIEAYTTCYVDMTNVDNSFYSKPLLNGTANFLQNGLFHATALAFGGLLRFSGAGSQSQCIVSDAAIWNRALSTNDIFYYMKDGITNVIFTGSLFTALASTFPSVAQGDDADFSWSSTANAITLNLTPNVGSVNSLTSFGKGSIDNASTVINSNTTFTLTGVYSGGSASNSVTINCVSNVAAGWHYIDDFRYLSNGPIVGQAGWENPISGPEYSPFYDAEVYTTIDDHTKYMSFDDTQTTAADTGGVLLGHPLNNYATAVNTSNTYFFTFYIDPYIASNGISSDPNIGFDLPNIDVAVALTDQGVLLPEDTQGTPTCVGFRIYRNDPGNGLGGGAAVGSPYIPYTNYALNGIAINLLANNGPADFGNSGDGLGGGLTPSGYSYTADQINGDTNGLAPGFVYKVWIDVFNNTNTVITNVTSATAGVGKGGEQTNGITWSLWLQRSDWLQRTNLFSSLPASTNHDGTITIPSGLFMSGREESTADGVFPQNQTPLNLLLTGSGTTTEQATNFLRFSDFYVTFSGTNSGVPAAISSFNAGQ
jgi:hypothetical protein